MASFYDEKAKCRVGEMDADQFYAECDEDTGPFFKSLMTAWTKAGGSLKWGAGGVGLRVSLGGKAKDAKEVGVCFLAPKYAGKQDRIELACTTLAKQIGQSAMKLLNDKLREAAGEQVKGATMISVVCPGQLPPKSQKAVIEALLVSRMGS
ncbi:MAG: hypothetical protein HY040_08050 [Planctomycetes bacterium]|nr:hypothetical protein [Planctomycetota bacterium]